MLTVAASNLLRSGEVSVQLSIFDNNDEQSREKRKNSEKTVDKIRQKYGNSAIIKGAVLDTDMGIYTAPDKKKV